MDHELTSGEKKVWFVTFLSVMLLVIFVIGFVAQEIYRIQTELLTYEERREHYQD